LTQRNRRPLQLSAPVLPSVGRSWPLVVWLGLLVVLEFSFLYWVSSGRYFALRLLEPGWAWLMHTHFYARFFVVGLGLLACAAYFDADNRRLLLAQRPGVWLITVHVAAIAAVIGLQPFLPPMRVGDTGDATGLQWIYLPAVTQFLVAGVTGFLLFVPIHRLSRKECRTLLARAKLPARAAILLTLLIAGKSFFTALNHTEVVRAFGSVFEGITLDLSLFFYSLPNTVMPEILAAENGNPILAHGSFAIQMAPSCAGYQGMMAATAILIAVLALDCRRLHLPRAIVFTILTVCMVFLMNAARIATLLYVGIYIAPEVAVGGFHSYFGTLSLLVVVGMALFALQHPFFERVPTDGTIRTRQRPLVEYSDLVPLIMPLAIMLAFSFAVGSVQGEFNWFYGVTVLVGAGLMWAVWGHIRAEIVGSPTIAGLICGVGVYALWIAMVPTDPERVTLFEETFESAAAPVIIAWIVIRVLGSSIVVPVLEELAFRGGLQRLIARAGAAHLGPVAAMVVAVALSSLAFGLMHADILAATLAGLAYGALAAWRGRIGDAIVAHAVTNFLIAIHVLTLAEWSYW